jgi:hypothetical protein
MIDLSPFQSTFTVTVIIKDGTNYTVNFSGTLSDLFNRIIMMYQDIDYITFPNGTSFIVDDNNNIYLLTVNL